MRRARPICPLRCPAPFLVLPVFLATGACDGGTGPEPSPTLAVVNATCADGQCAPLEVRGWVPKYAFPGQTLLGGFLPIGVVTSASACLTFPAADSFLVVGPADTTVFRWTPADEVELMVFAVGTPPVTGGRTEAMIPANRPGWRLVYPDAGGSAVVEPDERCEG